MGNHKEGASILETEYQHLTSEQAVCIYECGVLHQSSKLLKMSKRRKVKEHTGSKPTPERSQDTLFDVANGFGNHDGNSRPAASLRFS